MTTKNGFIGLVHRRDAAMEIILIILLSALRTLSAETVTELEFVRSPSTVVSSPGKPVRMLCSLKGRGGQDEDPPDVLWLRDGRPLEYADTNQIQVPLDTDLWMVISTLRIEKVQLPDMGSYRCLPHFSVEPDHMSVVANVSVRLRCVAHGPPEPVRVIWLRDGAPLNTLREAVALSPSTLNLTGLNRTSSFSCEAHNDKGVATSASGTITVESTQTSLRAKPSGERDSDGPPGDLVHNQNVNIPPTSHLVEGLEPHGLYAIRVSCHSSQGPSGWGPWVDMKTREGVPDSAPVNLSAVCNGTEAVVEVGLETELSLNLSTPLSNVTFRVCAYTGAGPGPWTPESTLTLVHP
ncbi:hypothetical protein NHX12_008775, partial [Muraenolepis orangiensis]